MLILNGRWLMSKNLSVLIYLSIFTILGISKNRLYLLILMILKILYTITNWDLLIEIKKSQKIIYENILFVDQIKRHECKKEKKNCEQRE